MIGKSQNGFIQTLNTILFILLALQLSSSCMICILYALVVYKVKKSAKNVSASKESKDKILLRTVIITSLMNITCQIPSSIVFILSLALPEISYKLLVYTVIAILSINAMTNPVILNSSTFQFPSFILDFKARVAKGRIGNE